MDRITLQQLRRVFIGEITNWAALGGEDKPIDLHCRPDRSGTYKYFCDSVLLGRSVPDSTKRHPENSEETNAVVQDPCGIGFVPMSTTGTARVLKVGEEGSANFSPDEWIVTPESRAVIDQQLSSWLKMYPAAAKGGLIAEGWSDSVGSDDVCRQLSLKRAQAVANYISETLGIHVTAIGKGKSLDLPNTAEENKQQNRRVVIKLAKD